MTGPFFVLLRKHRVVLISAILFSILVSLPQVFFRLEHKETGVYQGIELIPDSPWSARIREIQDGNTTFGSLYYPDGKEDPYLFQPLGSGVIAYMGTLFSLDINNTLLLARFVLSFFAFLLIYAFIALFSRDRVLALSATMILMLAEAALNPFGLMQLLRGINPEEFLRMSRPVNPAMIYILFFGFLSAFWKFYKERMWQWGVISAVILGLNFYNYFYTWTYLFAFGGILGFVFLWQRKWKDMFQIAYVFLGSIIVAIPYIHNLYTATLHPNYADTSLRYGVIESYEFMWIGVVSATAIVIFFAFFPKKDRVRYWFAFALVLTPIVTLNQQILTGKLLQAAHYHWFFHKPVALIIMLIALFYWIARLNWNKVRKPLGVIMILVSVLIGVFAQMSAYYTGEKDGGDIAIERQRYGPVMDWLNENAIPEEVVLANDEASHITVIYTPLNVMYHRAAIYSLSATKERLLDVNFTLYRLRGVSKDDAGEVFYEERVSLGPNIYGMHYREKFGTHAAIPKEDIQELVVAYQDTFTQDTDEWLEDKLNKYVVDYILWDTVKDPEWNLDQYMFLENVATYDSIKIYAVAEREITEE